MHNRPIWSGEMTPEEYKDRRRADKRAEYRRHAGRYAAYQKKNYHAKRAAIREQQKQYYLTNKMEICAKVAEYQAANKEKISAKNKAKYSPSQSRDYFLRKKYGISAAVYDEMLVAQGGKCANKGCTHDGTEDKRKRPLFVDHCHVTDKIRGLLCNRCNRTLGMLKESPAIIVGLAEYIGAHL